MKRREFIRNGVVLFAAPAIIKIENLMKIATPREIKQIENEELSFDEFQKAIVREFASAHQIPAELLMQPIRYELKI